MEIVMKCASFTGRYQVDDRHAQGKRDTAAHLSLNPPANFEFNNKALFAAGGDKVTDNSQLIFYHSTKMYLKQAFRRRR